MDEERTQLEQAIANIETQRANLGDEVADTALGAMRGRLAALTASAAGPEAASQRKQVTVLFADLSSFTAMSEAMDAEEVSDIVNDLWRRLDALIIARGGTIDKHIGDAVMALFGTPAAHEDDPECAVRAALDMQEALARFEPPPSLRGELKMRIGIHTGPVLLSQVGGSAEYTAIGDTVNLASRLEAAAPPGGVLISAATQRQVRGIFAAQEQPRIWVKGKSESVETYIVSGEQPRSFRNTTRGVEGIETSMVGRDAELRRLQDEYHAATSGGGLRLVTVVAEAGMGKSRLLHEFGRWLEQLPQQVWRFKARADPQMTRRPYSLMRDLLAARFGILDSDPIALARQKLEQGIVGFLGADSEAKAHFIGYLIFNFFADSPHLHGVRDDARQLHDRAFRYTAQMFAAAGAIGPLVLLLDDIHWADDGSLDLVEYLAQHGRDLPMLVVCLTRPALFERRAEWVAQLPGYSRIDLAPLTEAQSRDLVADILRMLPTVPVRLQDLIVKETEGNPFYLEELIKVLIDDGVIIKHEDEWQVATERLSELRVPPTLTAVLQTRLDSLAPAERETLQQASVVGRTFWDNAVQRLNSLSVRPQVAPTLRQLCGKELVYERSDSTFFDSQEYSFKHIILWDVTYESVLKRKRRIYHAEVAAWLIERGGARADEYAGLIGEHYEHADKREAAAGWYARAAKRAKDTYAPTAAIGYYQKALELLPASAAYASQRVPLYEGLAEMLLQQMNYDQAKEAYLAMSAAAATVGETASEVHAWLGMLTVQDNLGDYHGALASATRAETVAQATGTRLEMALYAKGWALYRLGEMAAARVLGDQALALSMAVDDQLAIGRSLNLLGAVHDALGNHQQAAEYMAQGVELYRRMGARTRLTVLLNNLASSKMQSGDYAAAMRLCQEAVAIAHEDGNRNGEISFLSSLAGTQVYLKDYAAAEASTRQAIAMAGDATLFLLPETHGFLALALLGQGKLDEALAAAQRSLALSDELAVEDYLGLTWRVLGMVAAQLQTPLTVGTRQCSAAVCFAESLRFLTDEGMKGEYARTLREWASYELAHGNKERGAAMQQQARDTFAELGIGAED